MLWGRKIRKQILENWRRRRTNNWQNNKKLVLRCLVLFVILLFHLHFQVATKRNKKEIKDSGEEDIEKILAEFAKKDAERVAVTIRNCLQPSPRSNFTMSTLPNGDMLMFGGEFCDGEKTTVFNDLFLWNIDKNEW